MLWLAAVTGALMLAIAAPSESNLMGHVPSPAAQRLGQPSGVPAERTLALVGFSRSHGPELRSWITGLGLEQDSGIAWVKMPVLNDPGNEAARRDTERQLLASHILRGHGARVVPVFTDRAEFIRAAGLSGMEHASVLVLHRDGRVLARAEGQFDQSRAQALRETLLAARE